MRVLILSCNTGQGHNSAASAIKSQMEKNNISCDICDSLEFISGAVSKVISNGHTFIYRHIPVLFRRGYGFAERHRGIFETKSVLYRFFAMGAGKLHKYIISNDYDTVICVHVFAALMMTEIKKKYNLKVHTSFVATDYTCSPSADQSDLDCYFIPSPLLTEEFCKYKIKRDRIEPCGIPIRAEFFEVIDKENAKKEFGINPTHKHLLMMCGSMGCGPMLSLTRQLSQKLKNDQELTIVCGTNQKLYDSLVKSFADSRNIHIQGYVKNMATLLSSCDLYITKPGGISVTEAAVKAVPMIFIDAVAGCEEYNMHYYIQNGGAVTAKGVDELSTLCIRMLKDDEALNSMSKALESIKPLNASEYIVNEIAMKLLP